MRYCNPLIAVRDMERSLRFYRELFDLEVTLDLGWCKALRGGLTLQLHFDRIAGFPEEQMHYRGNVMELYFETEDFDAFLRLLDSHPEVERLHEPQTFPWLQRGIRIYDPDGHLLEVSESMETVARREFAQGRSPEETAQRIQHPPALVKQWYERWQTKADTLISVCGSDCRQCACYGSLCQGCNACEGKVFHAPAGCAIHRCVRESRHLPDCGSCSELPCPIWQSTRDPSFSDEAFRQNIAERIARLRRAETE